MSNTVRIKRRASGNPGAPASLQNAELAYNEVDDTLYYGKGTGGVGGSATSVEAIAGPGAFVTRSGAQTIQGEKTFEGAVNVPTPTAATHAVNKAYADGLTPNLEGGSGISVTGTGTKTIAADATIARVNSPAFTGTPTAPTAPVATNNNQVATTAFVKLQGYLTSVPVTSVAGKTGAVTLAKADVGLSNVDNTSDAAKPVSTAQQTALDLKAPLLSPALTGTPTAPTAANGTNNTQLANTAFVLATRLDQFAAPTADVAMNNRKLTGLAEPFGAQDAATKNYVDQLSQGLAPKRQVKAASTGNIATLSGALTIDGIALVAGDRVLVKDQTAPAQNGIYVVAAGTWTRASDADTWAELVSAYLFVEKGATNGDNGFLFTVDDGGTLGTTAVTIVQFNGAGQIVAGAGLTKTGNVLDIGAGTGIAVAADTVGLTGQALALHNLATNGFIVRTAAGTVVSRSVATSGTGIAVTNGDAVAGNPTFALSAALASIGGLTPAADRMPYYTGAGTAELATFTAFGRSLIDDTSAAAARTTLALGTLATQNANAVDITGGSIDGIVLDGGDF